MIDPSLIRQRFAAVGRGLNERTRRLFAAVEARTAGYGGIAACAQATGIAGSTIGRALKDLDDPASLSRRAGVCGASTFATIWRMLGESPAVEGGPVAAITKLGSGL
jgi:hypothetical protein